MFRSKVFYPNFETLKFREKNALAVFNASCPAFEEAEIEYDNALCDYEKADEETKKYSMINDFDMINYEEVIQEKAFSDKEIAFVILKEKRDIYEYTRAIRKEALSELSSARNALQANINSFEKKIINARKKYDLQSFN